jgi:hypothetical protein
MAVDLAVSQGFGSLTSYTYPGGYNQSQLGLGPCMIQANNAGNEGKWVGPIPNNVARPVETSLQMPGVFPDAINWTSASNGSIYDWVLLSDNAAASLTRRFELFTFNRSVTQPGVSPWAFAGAITCSMPSGGGTYTNRGSRLVYQQYTPATCSNYALSPTVAINNGSPTLTGTNTSWSTDRIFIGSRVGIGSSDPGAITTWYEISSVNSDTSITLTQNYLGSNTSGQQFIIEDLRVIAVMTNATANLGGLFMVAGLRFENFTNVGFAIGVAGADKTRGVYWLNDNGAGNVNANIQVYAGVAIDTRQDWLHQNAYAFNYPSASNTQFQVNNFRAAMSLTAGRDTQGANTFVLNTGVQACAGTVNQTHNLCLCTPGVGGGPRSGTKTLFFTTTTRLYSCAVANLTSASVGFQSGCAVEAPPGTTTTFGATGALGSVAYDPLADRFLILSTGATAFRSYYTQYREDTGQWDRITLLDSKQTNQSIEDATAAIYPTTLTTAPTAVFMNSMCYITTTGTTATTDWLFNTPLGTDWEYAGLAGNGVASNCCVVTPVMTTSQFASFVAAYFNDIQVIGGLANPSLGRIGTNLGMESGAVRMWYRTSGFGLADATNAANSWQLLDYSGSLGNITGTSQIQFRLEFRMANTLIPSRVTRVCVEGTGASSINNFQFSLANSVLASKQFAFRQAIAFGANTNIVIRIYDAITGNLLVMDSPNWPAIAGPTGRFYFSTNGGSTWTSFAGPGNGLTLNTTVGSGIITSCTVASGGTGYLPSSTIYQCVFGGNSNAIVSLSTNSSGVVTTYNSMIAGGTGYTTASGALTMDCPWATAWDFTNNTTYLMYTPASIADNVDAQAVISLS